MTKTMNAPKITYMPVADYRKKFLAKFSRLVKSGRTFTADDFRTIGNVEPQYVGSIWRAALKKHEGAVAVVGSRNSKVASRKGSRQPVYQGI